MYIYGGEFESCETFVWKYTFGKLKYQWRMYARVLSS